ncbi:helix-turn-helix transcriptional regulator [Jiulongibacter sp. NS-SX5]|uniref:helix-turn-helix transcriptional regulator n=1 Tax=Jiulongibacter sp. NS-SX5 TaxID=3463854 RepID=UPI004058AA1E
MKNSIKVERAKNDFTQADLAEKVGVSRQTINSIEKGRFIPSTVLALKIAEVCNAKIHDVFMLEESDWQS